MVVIREYWVVKETNGGDIIRVIWDEREVVSIHRECCLARDFPILVERILTALGCPEILIKTVVRML
jgi:hypothetical protein